MEPPAPSLHPSPTAGSGRAAPATPFNAAREHGEEALRILRPARRADRLFDRGGPLAEALEGLTTLVTLVLEDWHQGSSEDRVDFTHTSIDLIRRGKKGFRTPGGPQGEGKA